MMGPKQTTPDLEGDLWAFQLVLNMGEVIQFYAESEENRTAWKNILEVMIMFPHSQIPSVPFDSRNTPPFSVEFRKMLDSNPGKQ